MKTFLPALLIVGLILLTALFVAGTINTTVLPEFVYLFVGKP